MVVIRFARWAGDRVTEDAAFGKKIIFSGEAHFDLGEYINKQNCRILGTENLHAYIEKPTNPKRITVWCGFWSRGIIGPFFFENEQGEVVTVNGVERIFVHKNLRGGYWQHLVSTPCHTAEATLDVLHPFF